MGKSVISRWTVSGEASGVGVLFISRQIRNNGTRPGARRTSARGDAALPSDAIDHAYKMHVAAAFTALAGRFASAICAQPTAETAGAAVDPVHPEDAFARVDR
jgi:hypothetical protein